MLTVVVCLSLMTSSTLRQICFSQERSVRYRPPQLYTKQEG